MRISPELKSHIPKVLLRDGRLKPAKVSAFISYELRRRYTHIEDLSDEFVEPRRAGLGTKSDTDTSE